MIAELMQDYYNSLAMCGHRIGSLRFERGGMRCPMCAHLYAWGERLKQETKERA